MLRNSITKSPNDPSELSLLETEELNVGILSYRHNLSNSSSVNSIFRYSLMHFDKQSLRSSMSVTILGLYMIGLISSNLHVISSKHTNVFSLTQCPIILFHLQSQLGNHQLLCRQQLVTDDDSCVPLWSIRFSSADR